MLVYAFGNARARMREGGREEGEGRGGRERESIREAYRLRSRWLETRRETRMDAAAV